MIVPPLAHSPTSLLSLPNDILLLILDVVYEERYGAAHEQTPCRIDEILINKRIFSLARPLWFRHLSINESQLDIRLAGLNKDTLRRGSLRSLDVVLSDGYFNLLESLILRLRRLTHLSLLIDARISDGALALLSTAIASRATLKRLKLRSSQGTRQLDTMNEYYNDATARLPTYVSCELNGITYFIDAQNGQMALSYLRCRWSADVQLEFDFDWSGVLSLDLQSDGTIPYVDVVLRGLEAVSQGGKVSSLFMFSYETLTALCSCSAGRSSRTSQTGSSRSNSPTRAARAQVLQTKRLRAAARIPPTHEIATSSPCLTRSCSFYSK